MDLKAVGEVCCGGAGFVGAGAGAAAGSSGSAHALFEPQASIVFIDMLGIEVVCAGLGAGAGAGAGCERLKAE